MMEEANKSKFTLLVENNVCLKQKKANKEQPFQCTVSTGDER
jgi:hypothetical protein